MAAAAVKSLAGSGPIHTDDLPIRLCEAFLRPCSGQAFAEAISRLPNQEIASLRNARKDEKINMFVLTCIIHEPAFQV